MGARTSLEQLSQLREEIAGRTLRHPHNQSRAEDMLGPCRLDCAGDSDRIFGQAAEGPVRRASRLSLIWMSATEGLRIPQPIHSIMAHGPLHLESLQH